MLALLLGLSGCIFKSSSPPVDDNKATILWAFESSSEVDKFASYIPSPASGRRELVDEGQVGDSSLAIYYTLPEADSFGMIYDSLDPKGDFSAYKGLSIWLYGDESNNIVEFRFWTGGYERMSIRRSKLDWNGWKEIHLDFEGFENVGDFTWSEVGCFEILFTNKGDGVTTESVIYIDQIAGIENIEPDKVIPHVSYI